METKAQNQDQKHFVVFWERMANSGYLFVEANNPVEASKKTILNPKFCRMTVIEVVHGTEVFVTGEAN